MKFILDKERYYGAKYQLDEKEKEAMIADFAKHLSECRKMIDWFDTPGNTQQKTEYFACLPNIFELLNTNLSILIKANVNVKEIVEALEVPF